MRTALEDTLSFLKIFEMDRRKTKPSSRTISTWMTNRDAGHGSEAAGTLTTLGPIGLTARYMSGKLVPSLCQVLVGSKGLGILRKLLAGMKPVILKIDFAALRSYDPHTLIIVQKDHKLMIRTMTFVTSPSFIMNDSLSEEMWDMDRSRETQLFSWLRLLPMTAELELEFEKVAMNGAFFDSAVSKLVILKTGKGKMEGRG
jgi:hypothetical protein